MVLDTIDIGWYFSLFAGSARAIISLICSWLTLLHIAVPAMQTLTAGDVDDSCRHENKLSPVLSSSLNSNTSNRQMQLRLVCYLAVTECCHVTGYRHL